MNKLGFDFLSYIQENVDGGDAMDIWVLSDVLHLENRFAGGKIPAEDGYVPETGAY